MITLLPRIRHARRELSEVCLRCLRPPMCDHKVQGGRCSRKLRGSVRAVPICGGPPTVTQRHQQWQNPPVHWLFDSYSISFSKEHRILVNENRVPDELRKLLMRHSDKIALPADRKHWPHPAYPAKHHSIFLLQSRTRAVNPWQVQRRL